MEQNEKQMDGFAASSDAGISFFFQTGNLLRQAKRFEIKKTG